MIRPRARALAPILVTAFVLIATAMARAEGIDARDATRLRRAIDEALRVDALRDATVGVSVWREGDTEPLYERNGTTLLRPASNMKLFTTAGALCLLGQEHVHTTALLSSASPRDGVLEGNLVLKGDGDPSLSGRDHEGQPLAPVLALVRGAQEAGLRVIEGDLIVDDSFFAGEAAHPGWPEKDRSRWYCAETGALSFNDNCIDLTFRVGSRVGAPVRVLLSPETSYVTLTGQAETGARGSGSRLVAERAPGTNEILIQGSQPLGSPDFTTSLTISDPGLYLGTVLREVLEKEGVVLRGTVRRAETSAADTTVVLAARTAPLVPLVSVTNKRSQNFYAEQLLKTLGARRGDAGSFEGGAEVLASFAHGAVGIPRSELRVVDGSGLARENGASARSVVRLLAYMLAHPARDAFFLSLPVSGVDGSLEKRLDDRSTKGRVVAKTGYIMGTGALSGYLAGFGGETYVFSVLINREGWLGNSIMKDVQDEVCRAVLEWSAVLAQRSMHGG